MEQETRDSVAFLAELANGGRVLELAIGTGRVALPLAARGLRVHGVEVSERPLQEKMALFWHGHFATNEDKVRDYRKMHKQLRLFQTEGLGNFRTDLE